LAPDIKRLNPLEKMKNLLSQNSASLLQALVFLPVLVLAVTSVVSQNMAAYAGLARQSVGPALVLLASSLKGFLFWKAAGVFMVVGTVDLFRQLRRHNSQLRMSKQDIRQEMKDTEGNPQMKQRVRRIQRDRARKQMMNGRAGHRDRAHHAAARLCARSADRHRHPDVGDRADGLAVPGAAGGVHVVSHHAAAADAVPPGAEHLVVAPDPAERQYRNVGRRAM
jgi:hypothetical protein